MLVEVLHFLPALATDETVGRVEERVLRARALLLGRLIILGCGRAGVRPSLFELLEDVLVV